MNSFEEKAELVRHGVQRYMPVHGPSEKKSVKSQQTVIK